MLTPSTSPLWTLCALSASEMVTGKGNAFPEPLDDQDDETEARREGKAAHWVGNGVLRGDASDAGEFGGEVAPNGHIVTADMVHHVQGYVDYMRELGDVVRSEQVITLPELNIRGVLDSQTVTTDGVLHVVEFKYGYRLVEAEWNPQLLIEACALWNPDVHKSARLTVYQPRPYHPDGNPRHWLLDPDELTRAFQWLAEKAHAANGPHAIGTPGRHCGDCDLRGRCAALSANVNAYFDTVQGRTVSEMTAFEAGVELKFLSQAYDMIKARKTGVQAEVEGRMKRGEYIPGWTWEQRSGNRAFIIPPDHIQARTGVDPYKQVLKSPAELEKEGVDPKIINDISRTTDAGRKLAQWTSKAFARLFK